MIESMNINQDDIGDDKLIKFPSTVPKSDIVYSDMEQAQDNDGLTPTETEMHHEILVHFKKKALVLYNKYISSDAQFQINISFQTKEPLEALMRNENQWICGDLKESDLVKVFDSSIFELLRLLDSSKRRWSHE